MAFTRLELATISAQFSTLVGSLAQQATSRTAPSTMFKTGLTGNVPQIITYVSKVGLRTISNKDLMLPHATQATHHTADTRYLPAPVEKRATYMFAEEAGLLRLIDMKSGWISETNKAFQREKDIMFVDAFLGNAITSLTWTDKATAAPNPANLQLPTSFLPLPQANVITAQSGQTITLLLKKILKFFESHDVNWREGGLRLYHNSKFAELLRNDPEWYTWNTASATPNVTGELKSYLGFDFIQLSEVDVLCDKSSQTGEEVQYNAADKCLIAVGKPICTGIWKDFNTRISVRHDMDDAYQVNSYMMLSSARMNEEDVCVLDIAAL